ncbi:CRP-like cAMP-binding protein [Dyadobacter sp. BE34]|uniref:CRP-like cAMP-binding protein n=1 Tax=Dyadobacter fermentans TaxID=94254 RepID=A0ABU1R6B5_9BACT|nr:MULTISPECIES: Crp/Fnr family transcriptional regulator [Dyadobacter]MDR6808931.1 CRP-like cAMP-binding protein [Dyadobacter fermentans]MDR7046674.1 CRP-like cAMP-binding protein [Dyadobacter sp. BE242]MDR7200988.1 CRP-like cAMP-binding protein [Dyadobacter sp. BE34]MDR7218948.1 CRP-like cAMP-binding protein [Dyadobacter sp. BE31]MDR7264842.1 CRP-like cAMP-binding protein [Dyadobacter sp. BE32]
MEIDEILERFHPLPPGSKEALIARVSEVKYPKGHVLIRSGKVEKTLYFIRSGIVRAYSDADRGDVTFWFGKEGDVVISMKSYVSGQPGYEHVETLEACDLYQMKAQDLESLFASDIHIANWGRKLIGQELIKTEERLISMQFKTAQQRYLDLMSGTPDLLHRVPLCHIASYLGITQVSLSRIRAEIR